jgi:hypothetical protein
MAKHLAIFAVSLALCTSAFAEKTKTTASGGRSYEECHALAVSRGVKPGRHADRYGMLKGFDQKTEPQGLIARCMAGKQT